MVIKAKVATMASMVAMSAELAKMVTMKVMMALFLRQSAYSIRYRT